MKKRNSASTLDFLSPLGVVPGLGPKRQSALVLSGIETVGDLLRYYPRRHIDRSKVLPITALNNHVGQTCSVIGVVTRTRLERGRRSRLRIQITDDSGSMEGLWFAGVAHYRTALHTGMRLLLTGKAGLHNGPQMIHPQMETIAEGKTLPDVVHLPQYRITSGMREAGIGQKTLFKSVDWVLRTLSHYPQVLPRRIEEKKNFPPLADCLRQMHIPDDPAQLDRFRDRLIYEEMYTLALTLHWSRRKFSAPGRAMQPGDFSARFTATLPFALTTAQEKALALLLADAAAPRRMHRLLQGDVGCGKTVVAFMTSLAPLNSGYQVAWMAPTEVLAYQAFLQIAQWLEPLGYACALLTGGQDGATRRATLKGVMSAKIHYVVGTHALLQPQVRFARLGMVIIDEQHKFGIAQRIRMQDKDPAADVLLMSATPIPQTLARTAYGDLDICTIDALPLGRHPVATHLVPAAKREDMERFIRTEITGNAAQAYYVVPRIEKDDDDDDDDDELADATTVFNRLGGSVFKNIPASLLHGRMTSEEKERIIRDFSTGRTRLLVSTTVVEVGIDARDATIMVIENAERFGLSQLHQLRGRVGRGEKKSYCFLLSNPTADGLAYQRLKQFCTLHDGFKIAELDLRNRGPGHLRGAQQSGWDDLEMGVLFDNPDLFKEIQQELKSLFSDEIS